MSFARALIEELNAQPRPPVAGAGFARASSAGGCSRAIWYRAHGEPPTEETSLAGLLSMQIGTDLHRHLQAALLRLYPDAQCEVEWSRDNVSGHADALYEDDDGQLTVAEFKTMNPRAWQYATQIKPEHLLQASIYAVALDAPMLHIVYVNTGAVAGESPVREFKRPANFADGAAELMRLWDISLSPELVVAEYDGRRIGPADGRYPCTYCSWRTACIDAG